MNRQWKPGDVASVLCSDDAWRQAAYFEPTFDQPCWVFQDNTRRRVNESEARPLVAIDPEDHEQVERLVNEWFGRPPTSPSSVSSMQAALRSLIAPDKPEEPQGLGAVVIDADDVRWCRGRSELNHWRREFEGGMYVWHKWSDIAAVKVLSEGVTL